MRPNLTTAYIMEVSFMLTRKSIMNVKGLLVGWDWLSCQNIYL